VSPSPRAPGSSPPRARPSPRHAKEKDVSARAAAIAARLKDRGLKHSAARDVVVEAFLEAGTHVSIEQLLERARAREPAISYSTVYRTLRLLVDQGLAAERDFGGAQALFEPTGTRHHDHLVCLSCGKVQEFEHAGIEKLQEKAARRLGFEITSHRLELYGRCSSCAARR
jgi:Fur family ferric uptake transcriptional regulator